MDRQSHSFKLIFIIFCSFFSGAFADFSSPTKKRSTTRSRYSGGLFKPDIAVRRPPTQELQQSGGVGVFDSLVTITGERRETLRPTERPELSALRLDINTDSKAFQFVADEPVAVQKEYLYWIAPQERPKPLAPKGDHFPATLHEALEEIGAKENELARDLYIPDDFNETPMGGVRRLSQANDHSTKNQGDSDRAANKDEAGAQNHLDGFWDAESEEPETFNLLGSLLNGIKDAATGAVKGVIGKGKGNQPKPEPSKQPSPKKGQIELQKVTEQKKTKPVIKSPLKPATKVKDILAEKKIPNTIISSKNDGKKPFNPIRPTKQSSKVQEPVEERPVIQLPVKETGILKVGKNAPVPSNQQPAKEVKPTSSKILPANVAPKHPVETLKKMELAQDTTAQEGVPIRIKWEIGPVKAYFENSPEIKGDQLAVLEAALEEATAVIQMYLSVPKDTSLRVDIPEGTFCGYNFAKPMSYEAHLVMIAHILPSDSPKIKANVIASASGCTKRPGRPTRGRIMFNPFKLITSAATLTEKDDLLNTIVHETFHAIAFNIFWQDILQFKDIPAQYKLLNKILVPAIKNDQKIFDQGHWQSTYIPNDLMVPVTAPDLIWTELSVEFVEYRLPDSLISRRALPFNPLFSEMESPERIVTHRCGDNDPVSKLPNFCSKKQAKENGYGCSADYTFVSRCYGNQLLSNNCHPFIADKKNNCRDPVLRGSGFTFESHGPQARCFQGADKDPKERTSYCLEYKIEKDVVIVVIDGEKFPCKKSGEKMEVYYTEGDQELAFDIICPDLDRFRKYHRRTSCPEDCNHHGICSAGKCICHTGWDLATNCKTRTVASTTQNLFSVGPVTLAAGGMSDSQSLQQKGLKNA